MKPTDDPPDSPSKPPANPSLNPTMTPPMTPIDRDIADAFAALDRTAPDRGQDEFTSRVMARIGDGEGAAVAPRVAPGRESPPSPRGDDSGLHDIVALASRAKQRLSERDQSESDAGESVMLAAAPGGLRAVALPDPTRVARQSAPVPPREPTRTDARSSLPFWALGSVATLAAAAAVAVFVFGIGRGADRSAETSVETPAGSAESAPAGELARVDPPARDPAAPAGQVAPAERAEPPPPSPAAQEAREWVEAASEERRPMEYSKRVRARERSDTGADTAKSARAKEESAVAGVEGGKDVEGSVGAPSSAPGGAAEPGASDEPGDKAGGEADLGDMLDSVTDEDKDKPKVAAPPPEAAPEPPAAEKKELDRRAVSSALESIRDEVKRCHELEKFAGTVTVKFVVAPSGQVSKAAAIGSQIRTRTGTCVARAVLQARFPAFEGTPISITYPFLLSR